MKIDGACLCGFIKIEAEADPETTTICHCTDCQSGTGSAFRVSIPVRGATLKMTGQPTTYLKTTADSGNPRVLAFCPKCGSPIYSTSPGDGVRPSYTVRVGNLAPARRPCAQAANLVSLGAAVGRGNRRRAQEQLRHGSASAQQTQGGMRVMIVIVFRSRLQPGLGDEYVALVNRMTELAESMPGYISHKGYVADDGERVTVVEFENEEGLRVWRTNPEHLAAQKLARQKYYTEYHLQVCTLTRESKYTAQDAAKPLAAATPA